MNFIEKNFIFFMSQWEKDYDDYEDYDDYFKEEAMNSFFDLPIIHLVDDQVCKSSQAQEYKCSTSKGPPDKGKDNLAISHIPLIPPIPPYPPFPPILPKVDIIHHQSVAQFTPESKLLREPLLRRQNPKFKVGLNSKESSFREEFYSIFLNNIKGKKIIPKDKVIEIHNSICAEAGVRKMNRDEYRSINNYFKHFAQYKNQIISSIIRNKEKLSVLIDLPTIIERAKANVKARKKLFNSQAI